MWCMTSSPYPTPSMTADDVKGSDTLFIDYNANIYQSLINAKVTSQEQICIYDPCKTLPDNLETATPNPTPSPNPDPDLTPNPDPNPNPDSTTDPDIASPTPKTDDSTEVPKITTPKS